jgi:DNA polymerase-3 subunit epsilon
MRYLSFDIEATGLAPECKIIEFAAIPFDTETGTLEHKLAFSTYVQCESFEQLEPSLDPWVIKHNKTLIETAHAKGLPLPEFKQKLSEYLEQDELQHYFEQKSIVLFGKSMNAIDLPFLTRDLGDDFMRQYFCHRVLDFSSVCYQLMDMGLLPDGSESGSQLASFLKTQEVAHTALEDAVHMAEMYLQILKAHKEQKDSSLLKF